MLDDFTTSVENLIRKAPADWLASACERLRSSAATATAEFVLQRLPSTNNSDLSFLAAKTVRQASKMMSWESLSWTLQTAHATYIRWQTDQHIELLWSGPSPATQIPARRIDQALYDLIANAKRDILLITFAAAKIAVSYTHLDVYKRQVWAKVFDVLSKRGGDATHDPAVAARITDMLDRRRDEWLSRVHNQTDHKLGYRSEGGATVGLSLIHI